MGINQVNPLLMHVLWIIFVGVAFFSCKNSADAKKDIDSLGNKVEEKVNEALNSETADSIRSKGEKVLNDVKEAGEEVWDTTKSKGGKFIKKGEQKWNEMTKKDSSKSNN